MTLLILWQAPPPNAEAQFLQMERAKLIPRQIGRPANRAKLASLTTEQLRKELGR